MRTVIWGTAQRAAMHYKWLSSQDEVIGFIDTSGLRGRVKDIFGIPVIGAEETCRLGFDRIILVVEKAQQEKMLDQARKLSLAEKVVYLDDMLSEDNPYLAYITNRQLKVIQEILNATDEEVKSESWMYERVIRYGIHCFQENWYRQDKEIEWNVYGLQQIPLEFSRWCVALSNLSDVHSAMEIGVYRGRSAYFMCAVLMRKNPRLQYYLVDIMDRLDHFEDFSKLLPGLRKMIPSTSEAYAGQSFDFVFIDADHSYDASISDYRNVGQYAEKVVGFHDIYGHEYDHENGGTVRTWQEVCSLSNEGKCDVFSEFPNRWMGIGCVWK